MLRSASSCIPVVKGQPHRKPESPKGGGKRYLGLKTERRSKHVGSIRTRDVGAHAAESLKFRSSKHLSASGKVLL